MRGSGLERASSTEAMVGSASYSTSTLREGLGHIGADQATEKPLDPLSLLEIDGRDPAVWDPGAHQPEVTHAREIEVVGEARDSTDLVPAIDPAERSAHVSTGGGVGSNAPASSLGIFHRSMGGFLEFLVG